VSSGENDGRPPASGARESPAGRSQTLGEEIANAATHGIGAALSVAALSILVILAGTQGDAWRIVGFSIYGATLIILYLSSTLYHVFPGPRAKRFFRLLDHTSINLLIAGTYTPITLVTLHGTLGWTIFVLIWGLAAAGVLRDLFIPNVRFLAIALYIGMGWLALFAIEPIMRVATVELLAWFVAGGLLYTIGVAFYAWKSLKYHHAIWHLFVLGGSITHFFGILFHLAPKTA
jgi:hemolysin III